MRVDRIQKARPTFNEYRPKQPFKPADSPKKELTPFDKVLELQLHRQNIYSPQMERK